MNAKEKAVRDAAAKFADVLSDARRAGLVVAWPATPDGLATLAISETARAEQSKPAPTAVSATSKK